MAVTIRSFSEYGGASGAPIPRGVHVYYNTVALDSDDTTNLINVANYSDKTVHVYGTFGSGGSVTIKGSNKPDEDGTTVVALHKTDLSALTFTTAGCFTILENPLWIQAVVTAGDGTTALVVAITCSTVRG